MKSEQDLRPENIEALIQELKIPLSIVREFERLGFDNNQVFQVLSIGVSIKSLKLFKEQFLNKALELYINNYPQASIDNFLFNKYIQHLLGVVEVYNNLREEFSIRVSLDFAFKAMNSLYPKYSIEQGLNILSYLILSQELPVKSEQALNTLLESFENQGSEQSLMLASELQDKNIDENVGEEDLDVYHSRYARLV